MTGKVKQLIQQLPVAYKCRHILRCLGSPTLFMTQNWIERLGSIRDPVWWDKQCWSVGDLIESMDKTRYACLVLIQFVGGPPKEHGLLRVYKGSLHTFLIDRIMYYVEEVGLEVTEKALGIPQKV